MQITFRRSSFVIALGAATLALYAGFSTPSRAGTYGDEKWCAVTNTGGDALDWDCEYDSVADCSPAVTQGNRGFCAVNPYYQPTLPGSAPQR
ncbi:MAG: DUF3551 domain-containing protein [Xanthobacteraceae bacterium]